jgi:GDPmannose 4,6-dehydratase
MKKALITGITGQDGSYLAEFLLKKGYEVHGLVRRTSNDPLLRIDDLSVHHKIQLHSGNLRDLNTITKVMDLVIPDEVYNLAAQSHVGVSFDCPEETLEINYYGVGRILNEAIRVNPKVKFYQASTSEMFGSSLPPQNENTPFNPVSPYAIAKLKAYEDFIKPYREKGYFVSSGILFNHESPRRGTHFVTRKITISLAKIKLGLQDILILGNLSAKRDWGFAEDYIKIMWKMLQLDHPDDFVIATGEQHTVREFVSESAKILGIKIKWEGEGINEVGKDKNGKIIVKVSEKFFRPNEVNDLLGNSTKAQKILGWKPTTTFKKLVKMMTDYDFAVQKHMASLKRKS